jgi:hypothetical protein
MKTGHLISVALTMWCLLAPPVYGTDLSSATWPLKPFVDLSVPLSHWKYYGTFSSVKGCTLKRAQVIAGEEKASGGANSVTPELESVRHMQCISSDDPLLKRN